MPGNMEVLTVEFKVNLIAPARGERLIAVGEIVRGGRTLSVCRGDAFTEGIERLHVATMLATMIGRPATETSYLDTGRSPRRGQARTQ